MADLDDFDGLEDETSDEDATTEEDGTESTDGAAESSDSNERVRALQSRADKATAEANKLRKELERLQGTAKPVQDAPPQGAIPDEVRQWLVAAEDRLREQLYGEDLRFKELGISADRIRGDSPAAMRASAKELSEFIDTVESQSRVNIQREFGIAPLIQESMPARRKSFDAMSSEEFMKYADEALKRL